MTTQELQYAYWQRQRQQELYRAYRAAVGNQTPGPQPTVKIAFALSGGYAKFMSDGQDVSESGKYVTVGSSATIEVATAPGYEFVCWNDDPTAPNPRTFTNVQEDITAEATVQMSITSAGLWTCVDEGQKKIYERYPGCRDNWELRTVDGQHDPCDYVVFAVQSSNSKWKYGEKTSSTGGIQHASDTSDPHAKEFNVDFVSIEGTQKHLHFVWEPRPNSTMLTVYAVKDGQELTSDDIKLENIRYEVGEVERLLSYNYPWQFARGQELTLKASAVNSLKFDHWEDGSTIAERMITMDQEHELSAYFSERR